MNRKQIYQENTVSYCVNYKGQKIKPYKHTEIKKPSRLQRIINFLLT